jgi:hypothetical protein
VSGKQGDGGQRLPANLILGIGIGFIGWMVVSAWSGAGPAVTLFAIGPALITAGVAVGVLLPRWAQRLTGRGERPEPVKVPVERSASVMLREREDE